MSTNGRENILKVSGLKTYFYTKDGIVKAVDGVDLEVKRGEILGIVGESGCGKSVTLFSVMRLVGMPGKIVAGSINFDGQDLLALPESEMMRLRGNRISMIFQQPTGCLNPVFKAGDQISEVLDIHQSLDKVVELAARQELFDNPLHPCTQALMSAILVPDPTLKRERIILKSDVPSPVNPPAGCRFHPRCQVVMDRCSQDEPVFKDVENGRFVACWRVD